MKTIIYLSGILGMILLVVSSIGLFAELPHNSLFFISSLALLLLVFIPLTLVDKSKQNKKIDAIIKSHKDRHKKEQTLKHGEAPTKGWGMNNSPFRKRKSGLTWGGGNISAANATRGSRKSFFK